MFVRQLRLILLAAAGAVFAVSASATVVPDDFNTENGGSGVLNYSGFANWNVTKGSVDLIGNGFYDAFSGNGLYVDLAGTTSQYGALTSKTVYGPGTYQITLGLGGSIYSGIADGATVSWGTGSQDFVLPGLATSTYSFAVTLTGPEQFTIADDGLSGNTDIGATLFGFSVVPAASNSPVPEPLTLAIFGAGLLGAGAMRRRAAKKAAA